MAKRKSARQKNRLAYRALKRRQKQGKTQAQTLRELKAAGYKVSKGFVSQGYKEYRAGASKYYWNIRKDDVEIPDWLIKERRYYYRVRKSGKRQRYTYQRPYRVDFVLNVKLYELRYPHDFVGEFEFPLYWTYETIPSRTLVFERIDEIIDQMIVVYKDSDKTAIITLVSGPELTEQV